MAKALSFTVAVANGKCQFNEQHLQAIRAFLEPLNDKAVSVTFAKPKSTRSLKANAFYFGVVLSTIAAETGNDLDDLHEAYKSLFIPRSFVKLGSKEIEVTRTTTTMTPTEFGEFIEKVCAHAGRELGIVIPEAS